MTGDLVVHILSARTVTHHHRVLREALEQAVTWQLLPKNPAALEQSTAAAMLDRLLHHAAVVVTEGESVRMREARVRGGLPMKKTR